jgi:hypothetical protein
MHIFAFNVKLPIIIDFRFGSSNGLCGGFSKDPSRDMETLQHKDPDIFKPWLIRQTPECGREGGWSFRKNLNLELAEERSLITIG